MALLADYGDDARILAGGQSLLPMLNLRLIDPAVLIDISRIAALDAIRDRGNIIEIGAAVTQNKLMAWPELKLKAAAARRGAAVRRPFPDPQQGHGVRLDRACRSELGNSAGARGRRRRGGAALAKSAASACSPRKPFQQDMLTTARAPDELVAAVRFPVIEGKGTAFDEVARRHGDFAIIAVAAIADTRGAVTLGVGGMAGRPMVRSIDGDAPAAMPPGPKSSKATRICTPVGGAAARSAAQSRRRA